MDSPKLQAVYQLAQTFVSMLVQQTSDGFDKWLVSMENCGIKKLQNFAVSLQQDYDAVKASLVYDWSNDQVEGQANRLKTTKRQMYGKANIELLRQRVLGFPKLLSHKLRENLKLGASHDGTGHESSPWKT